MLDDAGAFGITLQVEREAALEENDPNSQLNDDGQKSAERFRVDPTQTLGSDADSSSEQENDGRQL